MIKSKTMEKNILEYCVMKCFNNQAGISAIDIATEHHVSHDRVKQLLENLEKRALGCLNKNVKMSVFVYKMCETFKLIKAKDYTTHIFFPSDQVMDYFAKKRKR